MATRGERAADWVVNRIGSWKFILIQTTLIIAWVVVNSLAFTQVIHLDPFPFILLNLFFSTQAAYTGPIVLMASNRQGQVDSDRIMRIEAVQEEVRVWHEQTAKNQVDMMKLLIAQTGVLEDHLEEIKEDLEQELEEHHGEPEQG